MRQQQGLLPRQPLGIGADLTLAIEEQPVRLLQPPGQEPEADQADGAGRGNGSSRPAGRGRGGSAAPLRRMAPAGAPLTRASAGGDRHQRWLDRGRRSRLPPGPGDLRLGFSLLAALSSATATGGLRLPFHLRGTTHLAHPLYRLRR